MASQHLFRSAALVVLIAACAETKRSVEAEVEPETEVVSEGPNLGTQGNQIAGGAKGGASNGQKSDAELCKATATQRALPVPLHLVVVFDASKSMIDAKYEGPEGGTTNRFDATRNALTEYAKLKQLTDLYMSVVPFGLPAPLEGGVGEDQCVAEYYVPLLKDTKLPAPGTVSTMLEGLESKGSTPTAGGVLGALAYAKRVKAKYPTHNVALVLATDGDANNCGGSTGAVIALKKAQTAGFNTFVIGIADAPGGISSLDAMAVAGGTKTPVMIDGNSAKEVTKKMNAKFQDIRTSFSCELAIPATLPDSSEPVNKSSINVQLTDGAGVKSQLVYSQDCSKNNAFYYDDAANPTKVLLCEDTCSLVRSDVNFAQDMYFGCPSKVN